MRRAVSDLTLDKPILSRATRGNGYCESFNARVRDGLLNGDIFYSFREARIVIESQRKYYNTKRPHNAPGYRPQAPETIVSMEPRPIVH